MQLGVSRRMARSRIYRFKALIGDISLKSNLVVEYDYPGLKQGGEEVFTLFLENL